MTKSIQPGIGELPTLAQLNRATFFAALAAAAILVTTVLPAEYGVDPTGIGRVLGLKEMGDAKAAAEAAEHGAVPTDTNAQPQQAAVLKSGEPVTVKLTLAPNEGREVKATMTAGGEFDYEWKTDGPELRFELHGEPAGAVGDEFTSYEKGTSAGASGKFRAPFDGTHGWYWKNRNAQPVTVTVTAKGTFQSFALKP